MFSNLFTLGRDVQVRFTQSGDAVAGLALAYNYGKKGQDGRYPTQWVEGSLWGKQAEALAPYLQKGGKVFASIDDLHIEEYQGKDGSTKSKLVGRVSSIKLAGSKGDAQVAPAPMPAPAPAPRPASSAVQDDSDIPFN